MSNSILHIVAAVLLVDLFVTAFIVFYFRNLKKRQVAAAPPTCGECGYNLTASESNRCPECGKLFIEAGIHHGQVGGTTGNRPMVIAIIIGGAVTAAILMTLLFGTLAVSRAQQARAMAVAAQAQAAAVRAQAAVEQAAAEQAAESRARLIAAAASRPATRRSNAD